MFEVWKDELTPEEENRLLDQAAAEIKKRKMETPAMLFLEMHRPLSFVASQASVVFSPFLVPFLGFDNVHDYSRLFAKPTNVERLLDRLDAQEPKAAKEDSCI